MPLDGDDSHLRIFLGDGYSLKGDYGVVWHHKWPEGKYPGFLKSIGCIRRWDDTSDEVSSEDIGTCFPDDMHFLRGEVFEPNHNCSDVGMYRVISALQAGDNVFLTVKRTNQEQTYSGGFMFWHQHDDPELLEIDADVREHAGWKFFFAPLMVQRYPVCITDPDGEIFINSTALAVDSKTGERILYSTSMRKRIELTPVSLNIARLDMCYGNSADDSQRGYFLAEFNKSGMSIWTVSDTDTNTDLVLLRGSLYEVIRSCVVEYPRPLANMIITPAKYKWSKFIEVPASTYGF